MNATVGTFEEYLTALRPYIKQGVMRQMGANFQDKENLRHPFLSWEDLEQECALKLWKVYEQHRETKPWQDLCRIGGSAIKGCILDVIDRTRVRGQAGAVVVSIDAPLDNGHGSRATGVPRKGGRNTPREGQLRLGLNLVGTLPDLGATQIEEIEAVEGAALLASLLGDDERLVLRELIVMSNRTLEIFEDIRRTAHRNKPTDIVRFEAIARALEVPFKAVLAVATKLRGLEGRFDAARY